jgi:hypothetical protein
MAGGFTTGNSAHLTRSAVWSSNLKEILKDELIANKYVDWLSDFPDGNTINIPSIGDATVRDYSENDPVVYDAMDTGNFQFSIDQYKHSGTYITEQNKQDGFYMDRLISSFVPKQNRAILESLETSIMGLASSLGVVGTPGVPINGFNHRLDATGVATSGAGLQIAVADFARAALTLTKANVSSSNRIAIVDPSTAYTLDTLTNIANVSNNPMWEGIVSSGIATGMRFIKNVYGFDVYTSNYIAAGGTAGDVQNMFFSADSDVLPFVGAWRQMPRVDSEFNKDKQRDEYVTTARYGVKLYRPENLVIVETGTGV